jgi:hypothetical protein
MSDWWSKKIAGEKPTTPRTYATPPTSPVLNFPVAQPQQQVHCTLRPPRLLAVT